MTPRINYLHPTSIFYIELITNFSLIKKAESVEALDQIKREQSGQRVIYQRESEIPRSPLEVLSQKPQITQRDISLIPFFKLGSYPAKVIKIIDHPIVINDEFLKVFQPPAPPTILPIQNHYPTMMPVISHSYSNTVFPQIPQPPPPPPKIGPLTLPSAPIPAYNPIPSIPMYDPSMINTPMDPFGILGKNKVLYNPITKKPQNYRTVPCRRFHSGDGCERGDNCHFIHDFKFQGRPIPNFQDWKNNNAIRQRNLYAMNNYSMGMASYYPPAGPETHNNDKK